MMSANRTRVFLLMEERNMDFRLDLDVALVTM